MKEQYIRNAFRAMSPSEKQKKDIYNSIIREYECHDKSASRKKPQKKIVNSSMLIASCASLTACLSLSIMLIAQKFPEDNILDSFFSRTNVSTQLDDSTADRNRSDESEAITKAVSISVSDIYCTKDDLAIAFDLNAVSDQFKSSKYICADLDISVNGTALSTAGREIRFQKCNGVFTATASFSLSEAPVFNNACAVSASFYNMYGIISTGYTKAPAISVTPTLNGKLSLEHNAYVSDEKSIMYTYVVSEEQDGIFLDSVNITPFRTEPIIKLPGENYYVAAISDQNGTILSGNADGSFGAPYSDSSELNIVVGNYTDTPDNIQFTTFIVPIKPDSFNGFNIRPDDADETLDHNKYIQNQTESNIRIQKETEEQRQYQETQKMLDYYSCCDEEIKLFLDTNNYSYSDMELERLLSDNKSFTVDITDCSVSEGADISTLNEDEQEIFKNNISEASTLLVTYTVTNNSNHSISAYFDEMIPKSDYFSFSLYPRIASISGKNFIVNNGYKCTFAPGESTDLLLEYNIFNSSDETDFLSELKQSSYKYTITEIEGLMENEKN